MRKLKLQVQITADGFIAGPGSEMDFFTWNWNGDINEYVNSITQTVDTILLGRNLATGFIPHWEAVANDPSNPEQESGQFFAVTPKVVFTRTLTQTEWPGTTLASELRSTVERLKSQEGGDIIVYGGGQLVSSLIAEGLIDEYHLFLNPVAIGMGMPIFQALTQPQLLELENSIAFECGIVLLKYTIKG